MERSAKTWHLATHDAQAIERLGAALRLSPIVAQLLMNRSLGEPATAQRFLSAPLTNLHEPALLAGVTEAAKRIHDAVTQGKRICVYGDYDVDGVTGTAVLVQALRLLNGKVEYYVPNRLDEGYGLNVDALRQIARDGASLVVTVDCGIASVVEADEARQLGLELIVTDHHEFKERLPDAATLVHPRLPGGSYPFGELSGCGVAFKLAWALCQLASGGPKVTPRLRDFLLDSMGLAALGTIADVMPLRDENRIFVRHGLARLRQAPSIGLKALMASAGLENKSDLKASDVAFSLAPRLNAAGRLGCARLAIELLTTPSATRATELARVLEEQNKNRQSLERKILGQARAMVEADGLKDAPALVLASLSWHSGLIGIVAGRLAELYGRPSLLIALRDNGLPGQGSGRSIPGFKLHEALAAGADHLLSHGGHAAAAGFKIAPANIDAFREKFCAHVAQQLGTAPSAARMAIDAEVPLSALTPGLLESIATLEPYGAGNPQPIFLAGELEVAGEPKRIGNGERHLAFRVRQQGNALRVIAFGMADRVQELMSAEGRCCLAFTPRINEWQGRRSVELEARDFQAGARARLE